MRIPLLAHLVTIAMLAVVVGTGLRWKGIDRGARWIGGGVAVFLVYAGLALTLSVLGIRTRLYQEVPILVGTLCYLVGFSAWQPSPSLRRVVQGGIAVFILGWAAAQSLQGLNADFSYVSGPLHALLITAAAGFTLVTRVRVSWDPLTRQVWFWFCVGMMIIYGTDILLIPLSRGAFQVRNDLLHFASLIHLGASVVGYGLMAWALVVMARLPRGAEARLSSVGNVRQLL